MSKKHPIPTTLGALLALLLALPGSVLAYDNKDAIRDCEARMRGNYGLIDLRESRAVQLPGEKNYRVEGKAKIDGDKYPWSCKIENRRVVDVDYRGRHDDGRGGRSRYDDDRNRGYGRDSDGPPPKIMAGRNGEGKVVFKNDCVVDYSQRGRRIEAQPKCSDRQIDKADQAIRASRREQGL